jgi:spore coat polysaccharide biosynthesis predicted glycosyltransferase SpsG
MAYGRHIAIFAESSYKIGTGHLMESLYLAQIARGKGLQVSLWVSKDSPESILKRFKFPYRFYSSLNHAGELRRISKEIKKDIYGVIIFNQRKISNDTLTQLRTDGMKIVCIDELGNRRLNCDVLINPSLVEKYHIYPFSKYNLRIYTGPAYLPMSPNFERVHKIKRIFRDEIKAISICMGGVDKSASTLKIIDALADWSADVRKTIILGGGFRNVAAVHRKIKEFNIRNFRVCWNVKNIASVFLESDFAFTAGGDMLYELACAGTPAVVLHEDEHEKENGIAFQKRGFGFHLGKGIDSKKKDILDALKSFRDKRVRQRHCSRGRSIVDGKGNLRILNIIKGLMDNDNKPV